MQLGWSVPRIEAWIEGEGSLAASQRPRLHRIWLSGRSHRFLHGQCDGSQFHMWYNAL